MLKRLTLLILLLATANAVTARAHKPDDDAAIRGVFTAFRDDWNTPGFPRLETLLMRDADFVVVTGLWLKGRDAIVAYHRDLLRTYYAGSRLIVDEVRVRLVDDHHAIAHLASTVQYKEDGHAIHRSSLATVTMAKSGGAWLINTFQNTITDGPGYMFGPSPQLPAN